MSSASNGFSKVMIYYSFHNQQNNVHYVYHAFRNSDDYKYRAPVSHPIPVSTFFFIFAFIKQIGQCEDVIIYFLKENVCVTIFDVSVMYLKCFTRTVGFLNELDAQCKYYRVTIENV